MLNERKLAELENNLPVLLRVINKTASQHQSSQGGYEKGILTTPLMAAKNYDSLLWMAVSLCFLAIFPYVCTYFPGTFKRKSKQT